MDERWATYFRRRALPGVPAIQTTAQATLPHFTAACCPCLLLYYIPAMPCLLYLDLLPTCLSLSLSPPLLHATLPLHTFSFPSFSTHTQAKARLLKRTAEKQSHHACIRLSLGVVLYKWGKHVPCRTALAFFSRGEERRGRAGGMPKCVEDLFCTWEPAFSAHAGEERLCTATPHPSPPPPLCLLPVCLCLLTPLACTHHLPLSSVYISIYLYHLSSSIIISISSPLYFLCKEGRKKGKKREGRKKAFCM